MEFGLRGFGANRQGSSRLVWSNENSLFCNRYSSSRGGECAAHQFVSEPRASFCAAPDCVASSDERELSCAGALWLAQAGEVKRHGLRRDQERRPAKRGRK